MGIAVICCAKWRDGDPERLLEAEGGYDQDLLVDGVRLHPRRVPAGLHEKMAVGVKAAAEQLRTRRRSTTITERDGVFAPCWSKPKRRQAPPPVEVQYFRERAVINSSRGRSSPRLTQEQNDPPAHCVTEITSANHLGGPRQDLSRILHHVHSKACRTTARVAMIAYFSADMASDIDISPLTVEYFVGAHTLHGGDERLIRQRTHQLHDRIVKRDQVIDGFVVRSTNAYPVIVS